jgi:hypothetical protein
MGGGVHRDAGDYSSGDSSGCDARSEVGGRIAAGCGSIISTVAAAAAITAAAITVAVAHFVASVTFSFATACYACDACDAGGRARGAQRADASGEHGAA